MLLSLLFLALDVFDLLVEPACQALEEAVLVHVDVLRERVLLDELFVLSLPPDFIEPLKVRVALNLVTVITESQVLREQDTWGKKIFLLLLMHGLVSR